MKRVRLFALLLASALFVSTIPVTGASAAQKVSETESVIVKEEAQGSAAAASAQLGWVKKGNNWYYVTKKGNHTGWAKINGRYYFFNDEGVMQTGFLKNQGKWYFFNIAGYMKIGWQRIKGKWYYFDLVRGDMKTGWVKSDGHWYYMDPSGAMANGWRKVDGKWYYLGDGGAMYKGPHVYKIDGVYYFFEASGALTTKTGLQVSDKGNTFYTNSNGTVVTNKEIGGKIINAEGIAVNKVNDVMDQKAQWYDSNTQYLVLADLSEHALRIYQGKKGEWTRIKGSWEFSCGAPATRTPTGQFKLCWKYETEYGWKRFEKCKAAYCYWTTAGFMLHTILYDKYSEGNPEYADIADDRLGMNISMSCIRLALEHARWIYTNIPHGTRLVVYE
ncbi:MAG: L,D-transpeptidase family protein [Lachnospiraceae bacterium]|nr:L,D-transpeptidase family protein [Lachnospiraceae bacterium]MBQ8328453.1 L,D-transpeptidase family protein [Lachnospiraceae bacterium]